MNSPKLDHGRIALIDDHALFLNGLAGLVESMGQDLKISTFTEALLFVAALRDGAQFDVVITDLSMRKMNGLALMAEVHSFLPQTPVIIVSGVEGAIVENDIMASGADGYLHKSCEADELHAAILKAIAVRQRRPHQGKPLIAEDSLGEAPLADRVGEMSQRQIEVLHLLGTGASNKEISAKLNISENTVKSHLKMIFAALGVNRRTASIQKARALGII